MFLLLPAANIVNTSGKTGGWAIHICRTPAASAAAIVLTATAALEPCTMSPTRSRIGGRLKLEDSDPPSQIHLGV